MCIWDENLHFFNMVQKTKTKILMIKHEHYLLLFGNSNIEFKNRSSKRHNLISLCQVTYLYNFLSKYLIEFRNVMISFYFCYFSYHFFFFSSTIFIFFLDSLQRTIFKPIIIVRVKLKWTISITTQKRKHANRIYRYLFYSFNLL